MNHDHGPANRWQSVTADAQDDIKILDWLRSHTLEVWWLKCQIPECNWGAYGYYRMQRWHGVWSMRGKRWYSIIFYKNFVRSATIISLKCVFLQYMSLKLWILLGRSIFSTPKKMHKSRQKSPLMNLDAVDTSQPCSSSASSHSARSHESRLCSKLTTNARSW